MNSLYDFYYDIFEVVLRHKTDSIKNVWFLIFTHLTFDSDICFLFGHQFCGYSYPYVKNYDFHVYSL